MNGRVMLAAAAVYLAIVVVVAASCSLEIHQTRPAVAPCAAGGKGKQ